MAVGDRREIAFVDQIPKVPELVPIENGGTGAKTKEQALKNLGVTATATELNYLQGVKKNIQEQLDAKLNASDYSSYVKQATAPSNTNVLWIDTTNNLIKFHNGTSWVATSAVWG